MNGDRLNLDYIRDMLESAEKALEFVRDMNFQQFSEDEKTTYAVIRALEILGEAGKKIPAELRESSKEIPWREIAGTKDVLIHEYFGINLSVVWRTIKDDLPILV